MSRNRQAAIENLKEKVQRLDLVQGAFQSDDTGLKSYQGHFMKVC